MTGAQSSSSIWPTPPSCSPPSRGIGVPHVENVRPGRLLDRTAAATRHDIRRLPAVGGGVGQDYAGGDIRVISIDGSGLGLRHYPVGVRLAARARFCLQFSACLSAQAATKAGIAASKAATAASSCPTLFCRSPKATRLSCWLPPGRHSGGTQGRGAIVRAAWAPPSRGVTTFIEEAVAVRRIAHRLQSRWAFVRLPWPRARGSISPLSRVGWGEGAQARGRTAIHIAIANPAATAPAATAAPIPGFAPGSR